MSSRKPPSSSSDWDDFDIPSWDDSVPDSSGRASSGTAPRAGSDRRSYPDPRYPEYDDLAPSPRSRSREPASPPPTRLSTRVPSRTTRPSQDPYRDPYSGYDDPVTGAPSYDDPRYSVPNAGRSAASGQYDLYADPAVDVGWEEPAVYEQPPSRRRGRTSRERSRAARPSVTIARPAISDGVLASIVAVAALGLILMAAVVWWGMGELDPVIPWHLSSSGDVDELVTRNTLWQIPFGVFMTLIIGLALGFLLWKRDRFAARFIVVSLCIVQVLAWVAVVDQLW